VRAHEKLEQTSMWHHIFVFVVPIFS